MARPGLATLVAAGRGLAATIVCFAGCNTADAAPRVVTSIAPVGSLAAGVMGDLGTPTVLVEPGTSPHTAALRPSQARDLQSAQVVFWIGVDLERFLEKPLASLPRAARVVALADVEGVALLPARRETPREVHDHGQGHDAKAEHAHGLMDMHIWLDPANAQAMVAAIARTLSEVDPDNAASYQVNAATLTDRIGSLAESLASRLQPVAAQPYVVTHDAYQYFERRFGLRPIGAITLNPEQLPSARHITALRQRIALVGARCIFVEPQFSPKLVAVVSEGVAARTGTLDPLGATVPLGPDAYLTLLSDLAAGFSTCLGAAP